jgi:CubicO group peptidase (beta-lactamase class C family)
MRPCRNVVAALLLFVFALPLAAQQRYAAEIRQLEQFIETKMRETQMPGLSVAIVKDDFVWSRGFGYADIENQVPATAESSYRMASVTKPMTAVGVMKLVEQGKIDLDAEVQKYVPYFPKKAYPVTVRQLLGHLGGISHYKDYMVEGRIREPKTTREAIAVFEGWDLIAEPGTRYSYSSYGFNLLGAVIEGASGRPYGDFMRDEVWKPLGMTATRMDDPRAVIPHRVRGYVLEEGKLRNSEYVNISSRFGGGGTRSTVGDMLTFITTLDRVLKRETIESMWTTQVTRGGQTTRYGLGFGLVPRNGRFVVAHGGAQEETRTELDYLPRQHFAVALASNFEDAEFDAIVARIAALFLGDSWNLSYSVPDKQGQAAMHAMGFTWNNGLGYYDRFGKARTPDAKELTAAFRYFNDAVKAADEKKIADGRHPVAGEAFIKVGAYMAEQLAKSGVDLERYHHEGELALFGDYIQLYRTSRAIPKSYRFDADFEARVGRWRGEWQRIWTPELQQFSLTSAADLEQLERFAPALAKVSIVPDYSGDLVSVGETAAEAGDVATASRAAKLGVMLYPESPDTTGMAGVLAIASGDVEGGKALLHKSRALDPKGYAAPENLERAAKALEGMGNKAAAAVLRDFKD